MIKKKRNNGSDYNKKQKFKLKNSRLEAKNFGRVYLRSELLKFGTKIMNPKLDKQHSG